jgi:hypothetical protein
MILYNRSPVNSNNEIEPGLDGQLQVSVAQHLEAERASLLLPLLLDVSVKARYETIQRIKHGSSSVCTRLYRKCWETLRSKRQGAVWFLGQMEIGIEVQGRAIEQAVTMDCSGIAGSLAACQAH